MGTAQVPNVDARGARVVTPCGPSKVQIITNITSNANMPAMSVALGFQFQTLLCTRDRCKSGLHRVKI